MDAYYLTFHTMTQAQSAVYLLQKRGINAIYLRAPRALSGTGCGYAVQVHQPVVLDALYILNTQGIFQRKVFYVAQSGEAQEVFM